mmetsp:Transcript_15613/g.25548  ORF Transcript_15613/g.25548 Transcript_15613/m.25548 type:complete len:729 (+) Transcript_15613:266-2452(+)
MDSGGSDGEFEHLMRGSRIDDEEDVRGSLLGKGSGEKVENGTKNRPLYKFGVGMVLYFEFVKFSIVLCVVCSLVWVTGFVLFLVTKSADGKVADWWTTPHLFLSSISAIMVAIGSVAFQHRQKSIWSKILSNKDTIVSRSVLVSSPAFRGSLSLVPRGADLAKFFSEKYGPVENVLMFLDIGRLVRLRRMRFDLRKTSAKAEYEHQQWRPRKGWFSRMFCCRQCRRMAHKAGEKQQDRYQRWMDRLDAKILEEEETHQVESIGCAIITFGSEADARALLLDNSNRNLLEKHYAHTPRSPSLDDEDDIGFNFAAQEIHKRGGMSCLDKVLKRREDEEESYSLAKPDHARMWWFAPSMLCNARFGDDLDPIYVRHPPDPDDIDFEALQADVDLGYPSAIRRVCFYCLGAAVLCTGIFCGSILSTIDNAGLFGGGPFEDSFFIAFLVGLGCAGLYIFPYILPERPFTTYSLSNLELFRCSYFFILAGFVGYIFPQLLTTSHHAYLTVGVWAILLFQLSSTLVSVCYRNGTKGNKNVFPLGMASAECVVSLTLTFALVPWYPYLLMTTSIFHWIRYFSEKRKVLQGRWPDTPHYGPDVSVSVGNRIPFIAFIAIFPCTLQCILVAKHSMPIFAVVSSGILFAFWCIWVWASKTQSLFFKYPIIGSKTYNPKGNRTSEPVQTGVVNISFGTDESPFEAGLGTSQSIHDDIKKDTYRLPRFHGAAPEQARPQVL